MVYSVYPKPVYVQPYLPILGPYQELLTYYSFGQNANTIVETEIARPDQNYRYFLIGVNYAGDASGCALRIADTSSTTDQTNGNKTMILDIPMATNKGSVFLSMPRPILTALRIANATPLAGTSIFTVFYIREKIQ